MSEKEKQFKEIFDILEKNKSFALACHDSVDGDGLGSSLALHLFLKSQGKESIVFAGDKSYRDFRFLPGIEDVSEAFGICEKCDFVPDIAIGLDYGNFDRTTFSAELKEKINQKSVPFLTIDHHPRNKQIGDIILIDPDASSTCEIIFEFFEYNNIKITKEIALCLLTGIITDTNNFRNPATTTKSLEIASQLINKGVLINKIQKELAHKNYAQNSASMALALNNLKINEEFNFAYFLLDHSQVQKYNIKQNSLEGLSNILAAIPDIDFSVTMIEWEPNITKGSLRSEGKADVSVLAAIFNGGGHILASGFKNEDSPKNTYKKFVKELGKIVKSDS